MTPLLPKDIEFITSELAKEYTINYDDLEYEVYGVLLIFSKNADQDYINSIQNGYLEIINSFRNKLPEALDLFFSGLPIENETILREQLSSPRTWHEYTDKRKETAINDKLIDLFFTLYSKHNIKVTTTTTTFSYELIEAVIKYIGSGGIRKVTQGLKKRLLK